MAGGGDGFLVPWTENLFGAYHSGWYGRAYDADGNPLQPEAGFIGSPYAVWTGERYLVIDPTEYVPRGQFYYPVPLITVRQLHRDGTPAARERGYLEGMTWSEVFSVFRDGTHVVAVVKVEHKRVLRFDRHGALVSDTRVDDDVVAIAPNGSSLSQLRGTERRVMAGADGRYAAVGHEAAWALDCAGRVCLVAGPGRIALVDDEGRPLREPQRLDLFAVWGVAARPDGSFRVYMAQVVVPVAPDGAGRGTTEWSDEAVVVAGIEVLNGRTWFLYTRDGVVYLRDLPPRSRAVRH